MSTSMPRSQRPMNLEVLLSSKEEYTRQLINLTKPFFIQGLKSIYSNVKENNKHGRMILREFQGALRNVPQWSTHILEFEEGRIVKGSGCDWLEQLLNAVYVVNVQIMTHVANGTKQRARLNVEVPTLRSFIHRCYISIARETWKQPYMLYHLVDKVEYQKNMAELDGLVDKLIREVIRQSLPYQELLGHFMGSRISNTHNKKQSEQESESEHESDSESEKAEPESDESESESESEILYEEDKHIACESSSINKEFIAHIDENVNTNTPTSSLENDGDDDLELYTIDAHTEDMVRTMKSLDEQAAASPLVCPVTPRLPPINIPQAAEGINIIMKDSTTNNDDNDIPMLDRACSPILTHNLNTKNSDDFEQSSPIDYCAYDEPVFETDLDTVSTTAAYTEQFMHQSSQPILLQVNQSPVQQHIITPLSQVSQPIQVPQSPQLIRAVSDQESVVTQKSVGQQMFNEPRVIYEPKNPNVKEIVINEKRPSSSSRMRNKLQSMFGRNMIQNISNRDIKENPQLVRRMLLKQLVDA